MSAEQAQDVRPGVREALRYLNGEQLRLAREGWKFLLAYLVIATGPYWYLDVYDWENGAAYGLWGLVAWGLGYVLFVGLLQSGGYFARGEHSGVGTYFVLGIVIGIPVAVGMVLLVVPGVYLLMRWLPAYARARLHSEWAGSSMRWSWERTEAFSTPLLIALLGPILTYFAGIGISYAYDAFWDHFNWTGFALIMGLWNLVLSAAFAWLTTYSIAAYGLLVRQEAEAGGVPNDQD